MSINTLNSRTAGLPEGWVAAPEATAPERVLVALSGGVDSSVAAALLVEAGHEVVG
ncbi:MAG: tRNA methyl transferase, partial [Chloroflexota bacterium]